MELNDLTRTCSMKELGCVFMRDILDKNFKKNLDKLSKEAWCLPFTKAYSPKNKAILYNTNYSWKNNFKIRWILYKAGFRQISSYLGTSFLKVHVLIKKLK